MSLFEFMLIIVSIIIGLGIAELLGGVARLIRCRSSIGGYWVHSVLIACVFIALLQQWWEIWGLQGTSEWTFFGAVLMLMGPLGLFLIAHLLFPDPVRDVDLRKYYHNEMRPAWWLAVITVIGATAFRPLAIGDDLLDMDNLASVVLLGMFVVLALNQRPVIHFLLVPLFLAALLLDIAQYTYVLRSG